MVAPAAVIREGKRTCLQARQTSSQPALSDLPAPHSTHPIFHALFEKAHRTPRCARDHRVEACSASVGWTQNVVVSGQLSKASPALAAFGDRLHMVHLGDSSNRIWHSQFDGSSWSTNVAIPDQLSKASPALANYEDRCARERLHIAHLGDSSNRIWHSEFDGDNWTRNFYLADQLSKAAPALGPFSGSRASPQARR